MINATINIIIQTSVSSRSMEGIQVSFSYDEKT